jgi:hypothetical protein
MADLSGKTLIITGAILGMCRYSELEGLIRELPWKRYVLEN